MTSEALRKILVAGAAVAALAFMGACKPKTDAADTASSEAAVAASAAMTADSAAATADSAAAMADSAAASAAAPANH